MCKLTFIREFEIDIISETLKLHQKCEGDVSCVVWDAAIVLAKYLEENIKKSNARYLKQMKVVELGAGVGCVGLTAACLGADVFLTDLPEVLPLLELNIKENEHVFKEHGGSAQVLPLIWGETLKIAFKPDLILIADCIYYKQSIEQLVKTLEQLTSAQTKIIVSQEMRESVLQKECWEYFVELMKVKFNSKYIPLSEQNPDFRSPDIKLLDIQRK